MLTTETRKTVFFRHAEKLTIDRVRGETAGKIPVWLEGVLVRNGPGIQEFGPDRYNHFFDGIAVLHRFEIKNGEVTYQNRQLDCDAYRKNKENERIVVSEIGTFGVTDPCMSLFERFKATFFPPAREKSDNCNVNVAFYGDQLYTTTERTFLRRVDPKTLKTIGPKTNLRDHLTVNHATAHPHIEPDGTVLNMGSNYQHLKGPHYCIILVPPTYESDETSFKGAKVLAEIPCRWKLSPCYYHSFGMTPDKFLFIEQPYCINVKKMMIAGIFSYPVIDCLEWHEGYKSRIYVSPRSTGITEKLVYETDNLFTFHHVNSYEENGYIVMDVVAYNDAKWVYETNEQKFRDSLEGLNVRRYVLPTSVKGARPGENLVRLGNCTATARLREGSDGNVVDVTPHILWDGFFEFPRINYKFNGKKYNYFYGVQASLSTLDRTSFPEMDIISKFDIESGKMIEWKGEGMTTSEAIFVANPTIDDPKEDDGVVLAALLHENDHKLITLVVLEAKNMKELATVKFTTIGTVTSTFHGMWAQDGAKVHTY